MSCFWVGGRLSAFQVISRLTVPRTVAGGRGGLDSRYGVKSLWLEPQAKLFPYPELGKQLVVHRPGHPLWY